MVGCSKTFKATTVQPNPLVHPLDTLRTSETITIITGDMDLEMPRPAAQGQQASIVSNKRYPLYNTAYFSIISRDRLRFHVQLDHKWEEYADLKTWYVYIEDDHGRRWEPDSMDRATVSLITKMWDREQQTAVRNIYGDVVQLNNDGWKNRQPLGSMSFFRGRSDFSFYSMGIFTKEVKSLTLVLSRSGTRFVFVWKFTD